MCPDVLKRSKIDFSGARIKSKLDDMTCGCMYICIPEFGAEELCRKLNGAGAERAEAS